jgi:hypothetical protein
MAPPAGASRNFFTSKNLQDLSLSLFTATNQSLN